MKRKILLVDDDILIARSYQKRLADKGHEVVYAADGEEALRMIYWRR